MADLNDIRTRLRALTPRPEVEWEPFQEYYGNWARLGPLLILEPNEHDLDLLDALAALLAEPDTRT